jgi:hypothetical protein
VKLSRLTGRSSRPLGIVAACAMLMLLGACSAVRLTYNNADTLARFRVSDYVDFTPAQAEQFKARFSSLHRWHRTQELPAYTQLLRTVGDRIAKGVSAADVAWTIDNSRSRYRKMTAKAAADAAPLLVTLTPEQLQQMEKRFAENNRRYVKDNLEGDPRRLQYKRAAQLEEYFRDWIGQLDDRQIERLDRFAEGYGRMQAMRLDDRKRTQQEALAIMRSERDAARLGPRLAALFSQPDEGRSAEYRSAAARYEAEIASLIVDMDRLLTPGQRARAQRRAMSYAEDLASLSEGVPAAAVTELLLVADR